MKIQADSPWGKVECDLAQPIDISIAVQKDGVKGFFIPDPEIQPFTAGSFVGSVKAGSSCNVNNILFNPHGNGTHTECIGHITRNEVSLNTVLKDFFAWSTLITVTPHQLPNGDLVISRALLAGHKLESGVNALLLRTLPNIEQKKACDYSGQNPCYLLEEAAQWIVEQGIKHLLIDLPSMDREDDGGELLSHKAFWLFNTEAPRMDATITEFIYVDNTVSDGNYLLNLQVAAFENDAAPSRPLLFRTI